MQPLHRLLALLAVLAILAAACGGSNDDDGAADADDGAAQVDATDESDDDAPADDEPDDAPADDEPEPADDEGDPPADDVERTASDVGVSEDTIRIGVLIADLQGLRDIGFELAPALTNEYLVTNISNYFDRWNEAGGINGRMLEAVEISWNPLDVSTMENACVQATLDDELFMVINASGFNTTFIDCFTVDNDMFFLFGETASQDQIDRAPDRLFTLNPPAEVASQVGTELAISDGLIGPDDKVGILTTNSPSAQAGASAAVATLEANGNEVLVVEVNALTDDNAAVNADAAAAVATFDAEGVDHALVLMGFTQGSGFWSEVGATSPTWERTIIDASSANCTPFGASRTSPAADGAVCVTAFGAYSLPDGGLRDDLPFEAACRAQFIEDYPSEFEGNSDPGVPSGDILTTADGEMLYSDYPAPACTIVDIVEKALTNAGPNPTRDSLAEAMSAVSGEAAFRSNGEGAYGPDKNFYSTQMQAVRFTLVPADTPRGDDGTFNGCPAPTNCWVPVTGTWIEIE